VSRRTLSFALLKIVERLCFFVLFRFVLYCFEQILFSSTIFFSQAYKNWVREHGVEELVPGLERSSEQMFFLSYAQVITFEITSIAF